MHLKKSDGYTRWVILCINIKREIYNLQASYLKSHDIFLNGVTKLVFGFFMYLEIPARRKLSSQTSKPASDNMKPMFEKIL